MDNMKGNLSVNLNDADTICPFCKKFNFSVKTANFIEEQLLSYHWQDGEERQLAISIKCDNCGKVFYKYHYVTRLCSILRLCKVNYKEN